MTTSYLFEELQLAAPGAALLNGGVEGSDIGGVRAAAIVQPRTADEVAAVMRLVTRMGLSAVVRGGGTTIHQGRPPRSLDLVLDISHLDQIVEYRPRDLTVTVQAGITVAALQAELARCGQMLALDPPNALRATVGGVLAANSWGSRRHRYGSARDLLVGSRAVLADGTPFHSGGAVLKNVAGYDLNKLLIGSFGTLAVITEATLRVTPLPAERAICTAHFSSRADAFAAADLLAALPLTALDLVSRPPHALLRQAALLTNADGYWLLMEVAGSPAAVQRTKRDVVAAISRTTDTVTTVDGGVANQLSLVADAEPADGSATRLDLRLSVLPSALAAVLDALAELDAETPMHLLARPGLGVADVSWYGLREGDLASVMRIVSDARRVATRSGGSFIVLAAPPESRAHLDPWGLSGADHELMTRVKSAFDPAGTLAPGRLP